jgi:hypothetical protein
MKLGMCIKEHEPFSMANSLIHHISNTTIAASQNLEVIPLILLEFLNRSSWDMDCIYHATWGHLNFVLYKSHPSVIQTLQPPKLYVLLTSLYILKFSFYLSYQILELQWKKSRWLVLPRTSCLSVVFPPEYLLFL